MSSEQFSLGQNLQAHRKAAGYSQEEFATLTGISRQTIHKHESNKVKPSINTLNTYAKVLGVSVAKLQNTPHESLWEFEIFRSIAWK